MKLIPIFAGHIWSVIYDDSINDAYNDEFDKWFDTEYIFNFLSDHKEEIDNSPWRFFSIEDLTQMIVDEADMFEARLKDMHDNQFNRFDDEFENLSKNETKIYLIESKAYGKPLSMKPSLLRLYAIRTNKNQYVITGGGIKFVHDMEESVELRKELDKLRIVRDWLLSEGIHISDDVESLIE